MSIRERVLALKSAREKPRWPSRYIVYGVLAYIASALFTVWLWVR